MSNDLIATSIKIDKASVSFIGRYSCEDLVKRLIRECDELRAENAHLRAQVAEYFREPETHPVEET